MQEQIRQAVWKALEGTHKVKITFKREAIGDIYFLLAMVSSGIVSLDNNDKTAMMSVLQSRSWNGDRNRTVLVTLTEKFNQEWFTGRLFRALEKIELVNT